MAKNQMKRLAAPKTWPIARKGKQRWITKPLPGAHKLGRCMPISVILRDLLELASTTREVKHILHNNQVLVNNKRIKNLKFGVGLFDVLTIDKLNKSYRVVMTKKNKLTIVPIKNTEANILPVKVTSKTTLRGGKRQINFMNGWSLLSKVEREIDSTILFNLAKKKSSKEIKLKSGVVVTLVAGKYVGQLAKLESIKSEGKLKKRKLAKLKPLSGEPVFYTTADSLFVVGDSKPEFTAVENVK